jgi:hypothetical protein
VNQLPKLPKVSIFGKPLMRARGESLPESGHLSNFGNSPVVPQASAPLPTPSDRWYIVTCPSCSERMAVPLEDVRRRRAWAWRCPCGRFIHAVELKAEVQSEG